jgi:hypothetical protein
MIKVSTNDDLLIKRGALKNFLNLSTEMNSNLRKIDI